MRRPRVKRRNPTYSDLLVGARGQKVFEVGEGRPLGTRQLDAASRFSANRMRVWA